MNKDFFAKLRDAIFPLNITCDICGAETFDNSNLCPACRERVELNNGSTCPVCGRKTARDELCAECKAEAPRYKRAASTLVYNDCGAMIINKFKNGAPYLKAYLGKLMAEKAEKLPGCDIVTYVPITKKRKKKRGYNQAELLANEIGKRLGLPVYDVLEKRTETPDQKSLGRRERLKNLKNSFKVKDGAQVKAKRVLVADDVLTTGATAEAVCERLLAAGATAVYFIFAASVEYRGAAKIHIKGKT